MLSYRFNSKHRFSSLSAIFLFLLISIFNISAFAAAGDLDTTFGNGGKVIAPIGKISSDQAFTSAIQSDGKIVVAGRTYPGPNLDYLLSRINPDGSLDTTFGQNGIVSKRIEDENLRREAVKFPLITSIAIQPDGKIVAGGYFLYDSVGNLGVYNLNFFIRLNPDGSFDTTFSDDGLSVQTNHTTFFLQSIALQADGKIVALENREIGEMSIMRLNADGTMDTSFGNNNSGNLILFNEGNINIGYDIAVQPDGKIISVGYNETEILASRLNSDGTFDTTFDGDGKVSTGVNGLALKARSVELQTDGKIVVAGYTSETTANNAVIVRYNADGSLDNTFDSDGIAIQTIAANQTIILSTKVQSNGKILIGGYSSETSGDFDFTLARFNSDGSFDPTFDADGIVKTPIGNGNDRGWSINIQKDGKIVLTGYAAISSSDVALTRYNTDGSLDSTFDDDGIVAFEFGNSSDEATTVAIQADGKIVVGGMIYCCSRDFTLARYNPDGTLDNSFGTAGIVESYIGTNANFLTEIKIQSDGKILAVGYSNNTNNNDNLGLVLARYNSDGSVDQSFGTNGVVISNRGSGDAMALQPDGKILVTGQTNLNSTGFSRFITQRFKSDGTLDKTFGTNGEVITTIFEENQATPQRGTAISLQADGKIVIAGSIYIGIGIQDSIPVYFAVLRYNTDGTLDTDFGDDGFITSSGAFGGADDLEIQPDGKIVVVNGYRELNTFFSLRLKKIMDRKSLLS